MFDRSKPTSTFTERVTSPVDCEHIVELRRQHRWGADHIAHETGLAASTIQRILNECRTMAGSIEATGQRPDLVRRYQHERPGELIHVDVKKISAIPDGGE